MPNMGRKFQQDISVKRKWLMSDDKKVEINYSCFCLLLSQFVEICILIKYVFTYFIYLH